jgi:hypothetical protein
MKSYLWLFLPLAITMAFAVQADADTIQLDNGDTLHGKLLSINENELKIQSDIHGTLSIDRKRVVGVILEDTKQPASKTAASNKPASTESPADIVRRLAPKNFNPQALAELESRNALPATPEDVITQLRNEGVDPALMNELQLRLPGFTSPKVQDHFFGKVNGLINGTITLQDIRQDAIQARDQLQALKKDLGPDASALDGYLGILENFIQETEPAKEESSIPKSPPVDKKHPVEAK